MRPRVRLRTRLAVPPVVATMLVLAAVVTSYHPGPSAGLDLVTVGLPLLEQNALLYVAQSEGLFEDNGLQVTMHPYDTGVASVDALVAGQVDIAQLAEFPFIKPVLEGQSLRIIAVNDRFEVDYLLVRTDRGIASTADLKGKRIGVIRGTVMEFYLGRFLELGGLNLSQVTVVDTASPARTSTALLDGEIDAVVTFEPHVSFLRAELGDRVTAWPVQNEQLAFGSLAVRAEWLAGNEDTVERFLKSLAEASSFLSAHPEEAKTIVQGALDLSSDYIDRTWPLHQFSLSLDLSLLIALNDEARWMMDNGLTTKTTLPDFKEMIYIDGLETVVPEAVTIIH